MIYKKSKGENKEAPENFIFGRFTHIINNIFN